jgi:hypothetical protein
MLALARTSPALADERPHVSGARLYVSGNMLVGDLRAGGLFSEEIAGTVKSGLPAVVELLFSLDTRSKEVINRGILAYELRYDVWEDRYMIKDVDSTFVFQTFDAMSRAIENLQHIAIAPVTVLNQNDDYSIRFSIAVYPLRGREQRRIVGWFGDTVRGEENSSKNQMLNLNDLIEHFFAREKDVANRSKWFRTDAFKPGLLPRSGDR